MTEYRPRIVYMGMGVIAYPETQSEYDALMKYKRIGGCVFAGALVVAMVVLVVIGVRFAL